MPTDDLSAASEPLDRRVMSGLAKIGIALRSRAWRDAEPHGITPTQGQILALLRADAAGSLRLASIAEGLKVTPATASEAVASLAAKSLVRKARDAADGRALAVVLTAKGRRMAERTAAWPDFLLRAVDALDASEQAAFLRGLVKMIRQLQEQGDIPVSRMCVTCSYFRPNVHADPAAPHHCAFVDRPFGDRSLRLDCADHQPAPDPQQAAQWRRFAASPATPATSEVP